MNNPDFNFDRLPPQNLDAEQAVLGSLMIVPTAGEFELIRRHLRGDCFYSADNQILFDALVQMRNAGSAVDAITVRENLEKRGLLEEIGGTAYLGAVLNSVPSSAHGEHYAKIVRDNSRLRQCIAAANELQREVYAPGANVEKLAHDAILKLSDIAAGGNADAVKSINDIVVDVYESLERGDVKRIPSGMAVFDKIAGGWPIGGFSMIAGRPGMGKSLVLKQALLNAASAGTRAGLISIEETESKVGENVLSQLSGVNNGRIGHGNIHSDEWGRLAEAVNQSASLPIFVNDKPTHIEDVEAAITCLALQHKCKLIGVDYLQLIDADEENENREITLISRRIKSAFKRLGVAGICAVQYNRLNESTESKRPSLRCLRGSGSLEQDGDLIVLLHSEDYYRRARGDEYRDDRLLLIIGKNKSGSLGEVPMKVRLQTQSVEDITPGDGVEFVEGGGA